MAMNCMLPLFMLFLFPLSLKAFAETKSYIVYFGVHSHDIEEAILFKERVKDSHYEFLGSFLGSKEIAKDSIFYSYTNHINAFAAHLSEEQVSLISGHPDVVSVFPNKDYELHTTRSWEFLGLESEGNVLPFSAWSKTNFGEDVIIGNVDSGVWPESESFNDEGYGPIPARWRGVCQSGAGVDAVTCNRKLIGARYFNKGYIADFGSPDDKSYTSPRDSVGHGTHTLSTAGGSMVQNASFNGLARGTAKGGSPRARVAAYKACWTPNPFFSGCSSADILAAIDAAIGDRVDVLTISLGGRAMEYTEDPIAIGTFHAVSQGIVAVCSAGNNGPRPGSVANVAPWVITVGASTMDREFSSYVLLGNNKKLKGQSLSGSSLPEKMYPLVLASDVAAEDADPSNAVRCQFDSLDPEKTRGKIVACVYQPWGTISAGKTVKNAGGVGMILYNEDLTSNVIMADSQLLPASHLSGVDSNEVLSYINSTKSPVAHIEKPTTAVNIKPAPFMAGFSSQGPNYLDIDILKPDVTAPGVGIFAAFSEGATPFEDDEKTHFQYNIMSGTSMAAPQVAGIAGLVKKAHPDWSPAAIKSAIMTTASQVDNLNLPIRNGSLVKATPFNYGAGHVQPNLALQPGLVYDITTKDYLNFFCTIGYNETLIFAMAGEDYSCPSAAKGVSDLNYPSISAVDITGTVNVTRTVKNVGTPGTYKAHIRSPNGVSVSVTPMTLTFEKVGEEKSFTVYIQVKEGAANLFAFGSLTWSNRKYRVRSPIVVRPLQT